MEQTIKMTDIGWCLVLLSIILAVIGYGIVQYNTIRVTEYISGEKVREYIETR